ncbi:unnamed protein product, partial [Amoebophrya sp. A25]
LRDDEISTVQALNHTYRRMIRLFIAVSMSHAVFVGGGLCLTVSCAFMTQEY